MRKLFIAGLLGVTVLPGASLAENDAIPKAIQGVWAEGGKCHGETVTFTAHSLQYKGQKAAKASFWPDDSPSGNGAVHYAEEGYVDNFEYVAGKDELLYNPEGYGMGTPVLYKRCH